MSRHFSITSVVFSTITLSLLTSPAWSAISASSTEPATLEMGNPKIPAVSRVAHAESGATNQIAAGNSALANPATQVIAANPPKVSPAATVAVANTATTGSGDEEVPAALNANGFINASQATVKKKFTKPKDADIMDEPWSVSAGGNGIIVNEDGMVLPHTNDFGHEHHATSPVKRLGMNPMAAAASLQNIFRFILPVQNAFITSPFGFRWGRPHQGIDMAAPLGSPIHAVQAGTVVYSGWKQGYGNFIVINHGHGLQTQYAHCSKVLTHLGQHVQKGELIGRVGSTGNSTGPHLHFEVLAQGVHRNPLPYLKRSSHVVAR